IIKKVLTECNHPTFFDDKEGYLENSSKEIAASNSNQEKEGPPQDSDILHAIAPILSTKEPEYSPSMGYENPNTTPETKSDEIIKSGVEELVPILSENEVTSEDKKECDVPVCENSPICDYHYEIFSDSNNDDDISIENDDFKDIEYVEASLPDPEIISLAEENDVNIEEEESDNSLSDNSSPEYETFCDHTEETRSGSTTTHADDSLPEYDSFCFEIEPDQERLINVVKNDISDDSSNDPLLEEANLFLAFDNSIPPVIEKFGYDSEGDIRFLEELLSDDSILFPNNESFESDFDNPSFPRPPPKPPDADFEPDSGEEISVVMNTIDEFECIDPNDEFDVSTNDENNDYFPFMFVIRIFLPYLICSKMVFSFLSAESEDTIFDPAQLRFSFPFAFPKDQMNSGIESSLRLGFPSLIEESDFDNPLFLRPPPEPPDFKPDSEEEISIMMNTIDELECLDRRDEFDDDDYSSFMFLIYSKVFSFLLFAESEDTIFDLGNSV
nr:hypothetical protein [Tanacetum cinerariifolium]